LLVPIARGSRPVLGVADAGLEAGNALAALQSSDPEAGLMQISRPQLRNPVRLRLEGALQPEFLATALQKETDTITAIAKSRGPGAILCGDNINEQAHSNHNGISTAAFFQGSIAIA
jgi:hypothetical protein